MDTIIIIIIIIWISIYYMRLTSRNSFVQLQFQICPRRVACYEAGGEIFGRVTIVRGFALVALVAFVAVVAVIGGSIVGIGSF